MSNRARTTRRARARTEQRPVSAIQAGGPYVRANRNRQRAMRGAKTPGVHRWIVATAVAVSHSQATAAHNGAAFRVTDDQVLDFGVACIDCQLSFVDVHDKPCESDGSPTTEGPTDGD